MAVITSTTFDPLRNRVNVRLQQGVAIVDADWNELDDIRKFEMRAYVKWFVGDGIPDGSDGFRIDATGDTDDFFIRAGAPAAPIGATNFDIGLRYTGRAVADGLDVIITADVKYKSQPLFAAAGPGGIPQIAPIAVVAGPVLVYLDIWERLVTSQEDPTLVLAGLGTESCARMKREWAVRTRTGTTVPVSGDADFIAGHSYLPLSQINRKLIGPNTPAPIAPGDLTDLRHKALTLSSMETRMAKLENVLLIPAFGPVDKQLVPRTVVVGQQTQLNGRNFDIPPTTVSIGNVPVPAPNIVGVTSTVVTVVVPSLADGTYSVSINTGGGGPVTATDTLTVTGGGGGGGGGNALAPTFNAVNPFIPKTGQVNQLIVLQGTNFDQPGLAVSFGPTAAASVSVSATQIQVRVPAVAVGTYTITVQTTQGSVASPSQFAVIPPLP
jgi:hypothetical protein